MNSAATETRPRHRPVAGRRRSPVAPGSSAVLVATSAAEGGGAAALQPWEDTTLLARLVEQFASLGVERVHVLTRPAWAARRRRGRGRGGRTRGEGPPTTCARSAASPPRRTGALVVAYADVVTQREVLAGLLAEPRIGDRDHLDRRRGGAALRLQTRARRGPHRLRRLALPRRAQPDRDVPRRGQGRARRPPRRLRRSPSGSPRCRGRAAARLAGGARLQERSTGAACSRWSRCDRQRGEPAPPREQLDAIALSPEDAAELERRRAMAPDDVTALLLVGLIRAGRARQGLAPALPVLGAAAVAGGAATARRATILRARRGPRAAQLGGQGLDGFFTTFFVSTYSKYIARWAARRGLTPEPGHGRSRSCVGVAGRGRVRDRRARRAWSPARCSLASRSRSTASTASSPATRASSPSSAPGSTRSSTARRSTSCSPGLAIGASRTGDPVWLLAGAALTLQTARHAIDFSYPVSRTR